MYTDQIDPKNPTHCTALSDSVKSEISFFKIIIKISFQNIIFNKRGEDLKVSRQKMGDMQLDKLNILLSKHMLVFCMPGTSGNCAGHAKIQQMFAI